MKEKPKKNKPPQSNKNSITIQIMLKLIELNKITSISDQEQILDVLIAPMSPNQVEALYAKFFKQQQKNDKRRQVLLKNNNPFNLLYHKFDFIAAHSFILLEID